MRCAFTWFFGVMLFGPTIACATGAEHHLDASPQPIQAPSSVSVMPDDATLQSCIHEVQGNQQEEEEHGCGREEGHGFAFDPPNPVDGLKALRRRVISACQKGDGKACFGWVEAEAQQISNQLTEDEQIPPDQRRNVRNAVARACINSPRKVCELSRTLTAEVVADSGAFAGRIERLGVVLERRDTMCKPATVSQCRAVAEALFLDDYTSLLKGFEANCMRGTARDCFTARDMLAGRSFFESQPYRTAVAGRIKRLEERGVSLLLEACRRGQVAACKKLTTHLQLHAAALPDSHVLMRVLRPLCQRAKTAEICEHWTRVTTGPEENETLVLTPSQSLELLQSPCEVQRHIGACARRLELLQIKGSIFELAQARERLYLAGRQGCIDGSASLTDCIRVRDAAMRLAKPAPHVREIWEGACRTDPETCLDVAHGLDDDPSHGETAPGYPHLKTVDLMDVSCDGGHTRACYDAALFVLERSGPFELGQRDAWRRFVKAGSLNSVDCAEGDGAACVRASRHSATSCTPKGLMKSSQFYAARACSLGFGESCEE